MNMKNWLAEQMQLPKRKALPILSFPCAQQLIRSSCRIKVFMILINTKPVLSIVICTDNTSFRLSLKSEWFTRTNTTSRVQHYIWLINDIQVNLLNRRTYTLKIRIFTLDQDVRAGIFNIDIMFNCHISIFNEYITPYSWIL